MENYKYIICPFVALIICQILKFLIETIVTKRVNILRLFNGSGGMPSTHTTFSVALTTFIGYELGFDTPIFAIALVFTCITSYDALGVRYESGKQAEAINEIRKELSKKNGKKAFKKLKEQLGHQPLEVLVGGLLGVIVASIFTLII